MCCHLCLFHFQMQLTRACLPSVTAYCPFPVAQRTEGLAGYCEKMGNIVGRICYSHRSVVFCSLKDCKFEGGGKEKV